MSLELAVKVQKSAEILQKVFAVDSKPPESRVAARCQDWRPAFTVELQCREGFIEWTKRQVALGGSEKREEEMKMRWTMLKEQLKPGV